MVTTYTQFQPAINQNFSFQPTLDGQQYNVIATWSLFGQRWIVNVYSLNGTWIMSKPLVASPDGYDVNIIAGYFTVSTLVYRASTGNMEVAP